MRTGRNEPCPCGSGSKYKNCHAGKQTMPKGLVWLIAAIAVIAAVGFLPAIMGEKNDAAATAAIPAPSAAPRPRPSGPAPLGKVWSAEHGHWHNAAPATGLPNTGAPVAAAANPNIQIHTTTTGPGTASPPISSTVPRATFRGQPQPGPAPPGKVWSAEHGHWHNLPGS